MNEPAEIYGRLKEGAHFAGYSFERACSHLEWLLEEDRWKISGQFDDVNRFLESIKLDQFRMAVDQRKRLAQRIKELQPDASLRAISGAIGASKSALGRDLGPVPNGTEDAEDSNENEVHVVPSGTPLVADLSGADAAKLVDRATTKDQRYEERRQERFDHIEEVSKGNAPLVKERRYPVVYADPPWRYENAPAGDAARAVENHYPTMALDEICALPVRYMAADDAMLFLWATAPKLADAMAVVAAWGFEYRTNLVFERHAVRELAVDQSPRREDPAERHRGVIVMFGTAHSPS